MTQSHSYKTAQGGEEGRFSRGLVFHLYQLLKTPRTLTPNLFNGLCLEFLSLTTCFLFSFLCGMFYCKPTQDLIAVVWLCLLYFTLFFLDMFVSSEKLTQRWDPLQNWFTSLGDLDHHVYLLFFFSRDGCLALINIVLKYCRWASQLHKVQQVNSTFKHTLYIHKIVTLVTRTAGFTGHMSRHFYLNSTFKNNTGEVLHRVKVHQKKINSAS